MKLKPRHIPSFVFGGLIGLASATVFEVIWRTLLMVVALFLFDQLQLRRMEDKAREASVER